MAKSVAVKIYTLMSVFVLTWAHVFAYYVLWMTMTYLTNVWKIGFTLAADIINVGSAASEILPIGLAYLADAFVGDFAVLLVSTMSYCAGLGSLAMSTPPILAKLTGTTCSDYKPECISHEHKLLFYIGLALIAVGVAGQTTSLGSFCVDQLPKEDDEEDEDDETQVSCNNIQGVAIALGMVAMHWVPIGAILAIPFIKPWSVRYGMATILSLLTMVIFVSGCCLYNYVEPQGSPLTIIFRVFVAATSKFFSRFPRDGNQLYEKDNISHDEVLDHTNTLCCLDKAAFVLSNKPLGEQEKSRWRLCTVTEVEGTKIFIRMIPMWLTFIVCGLVSSMGNTYFVEQANHMNPKVGRFKVPLLVLLWLYDNAKRKFGKLYNNLSYSLGVEWSSYYEEPKRSRYAPLAGIALSMVFAILCCITAAKVENRRLHVVASHGLVDKPDERIPMSMFWLLPQFILLGAFDGMYEKSIACLFLDQAGPTMKRYMGFFSRAVFGTGSWGASFRNTWWG